MEVKVLEISKLFSEFQEPETKEHLQLGVEHDEDIFVFRKQYKFDIKEQHNLLPNNYFEIVILLKKYSPCEGVRSAL